MRTSARLPGEPERKPAAEMTPAEHADDVRETLRRIRRELAVLDGPSRERKLRAGLVKPRTAGEWGIFASDHLRSVGRAVIALRSRQRRYIGE